MKGLAMILVASSALVLILSVDADAREIKRMEKSAEAVQVMPQKIVFSQDRDDYSAEITEDGFVLKGKLASNVKWDDLLMPPPWTGGTPIWVEYKWFCKGLTREEMACFDECCVVLVGGLIYDSLNMMWVEAPVGYVKCDDHPEHGDVEKIKECEDECGIDYKYQCEKKVFVGYVSGKCEPVGDNAGEFVCNINMDDIGFKISDYPQELEQPSKGSRVFMTPWDRRLIDEDEFDLHIAFRAQYETQAASTSSFSMRELLKVKPKAVKAESPEAMEESVSQPMQQ